MFRFIIFSDLLKFGGIIPIFNKIEYGNDSSKFDFEIELNMY